MVPFKFHFNSIEAIEAGGRIKFTIFRHNPKSMIVNEPVITNLLLSDQTNQQCSCVPILSKFVPHFHTMQKVHTIMEITQNRGQLKDLPPVGKSATHNHN